MKLHPSSGVLSLFLLAGLPVRSAEALEFKDVAGRWLLDIDYVHELWKKDRGDKYSESEWQTLRKDPSAIDCDEVRLDEKTLAFFHHGKQNVAYPVLGSQVEKEVVWVDFKHFLGRKMRTGFVRDGERLKLIHSDGFWKLFAGYRRAP